MERTFAGELNEGFDKKRILLKGWVHEIRDLKRIKFILLRDFTGIAQLVALDEPSKREFFESIPKIPIESIISVEGIAKKSDIAKSGIEVVIEKLEILSKAEKLPIPLVEKGVDTGFAKRFDYRSIDLRKPKNLAIFKIESAIVEGMTNFLQKKCFIQVFTPCIMGAASESGSEVFAIKYYEKEAYLRQDPQLHRQLTIAGGFESIYDLGPSWRAEKSHTVRHLCEHRTCAVEKAFIKDELEIERIEEGLVVSALENAKKKCPEALQLLNIELKIPTTPFPELRFPQIYDILNDAGKRMPEDADLDSQAMELLGNYVKEKHKADFYFINRFPSAIKPFYVMKVDEEPRWARSIDLNFGKIELSSGGQREHRYEKIMEHIAEKGLDPKKLEWFTSFFKYGVPPHGGFAIGIERLTQAVLNLSNIREAVLFPREPDRLLP